MLTTLLAGLLFLRCMIDTNSLPSRFPFLYSRISLFDVIYTRPMDLVIVGIGVLIVSLRALSIMFQLKTHFHYAVDLHCNMHTFLLFLVTAVSAFIALEILQHALFVLRRVYVLLRGSRLNNIQPPAQLCTAIKATEFESINRGTCRRELDIYTEHFLTALCKDVVNINYTLHRNPSQMMLCQLLSVRNVWLLHRVNRIRLPHSS